MSDKTGIEWTDRTWNPLTGCTKVSPGCDNCYAKTMHERFNGPGSFNTVQLHPERLTQPLRWRKPSMVFVNSMSDLFHQDVPDEFIARVFAVMAAAPEHTFQVLTKRHARMRSLLSSLRWAELLCDAPEWPTAFLDGEPYGIDIDPERPLSNVWLGVSVEDQQWADIRIPALLDTPAAVRFLSCEPLLGPIDFRWTPYAHQASGETYRQYLDRNGSVGQYEALSRIDWVIVGGESGRGARVMQADWARSLRDQCQAAGVPFLFKQWGEWAPQKTLSVGCLSDPRERHGELVTDGKHPDIAWRRLYRRVGKKAAGRELDGRTWDEYPAGISERRTGAA